MMHKTAGVVASRFNSTPGDGAVVALVVDILPYLLMVAATSSFFLQSTLIEFTVSSYEPGCLDLQVCQPRLAKP